jgi:succinylarginine dihydrolase
VADPATIDPRFLLSDRSGEGIARTIAGNWPEQIDPADLGNPALANDVIAARAALLQHLDLAELI